MRFKTWLIHLLGGKTKEEFDKERCGGKHFTLSLIKEYADRMYGVEANEWCDKMYSYVNDWLKELENE